MQGAAQPPPEDNFLYCKQDSGRIWKVFFYSRLANELKVTSNHDVKNVDSLEVAASVPTRKRCYWAACRASISSIALSSRFNVRAFPTSSSVTSMGGDTGPLVTATRIG